MADSRSEADHGSTLAAVSNAMVAPHKEQFGRGPGRARGNFADADTLVCVRESRMDMQVATADQFTTAVEQIVGRHVRAFASALDPDMVLELFTFHPQPAP